MPTPSLHQLRAHAISQSLFTPTTLPGALDRLGFVQADPIRAPARAQDLILRHRVKAYRAGDLERHYPALNIEEDLLYAYGFVTRPVWKLLHPRAARSLSPLEKKVHEVVGKSGLIHPRELQTHFGRQRIVNAWGGYSQATKRALERLHFNGLLRVAGRENGIRLYAPAPPPSDHLSPAKRFSALIMTVANILTPLPRKSLQQTVNHLRRWLNVPQASGHVIAELLRTGELEEQTVDGVPYLWPAGKLTDRPASPVVRFLAPFDPIVWDRRRFEHFWKWPYRFEAYTPPAKRIRGYYAMPLLWRDSIIGWANATVSNGHLAIEVGYVAKPPRDPEYRAQLNKETSRLRTFLCLD